MFGWFVSYFRLACGHTPQHKTVQILKESQEGESGGTVSVQPVASKVGKLIFPDHQKRRFLKCRIFRINMLLIKLHGFSKNKIYA